MNKTPIPALILAVLALAASLPARTRAWGDALRAAPGTSASKPYADARTRRQVARLFARHLKPDGSGKDQLLAAVARLPYFASRGRDPKRAVEFRQLELSVRLAPDAARVWAREQARR